MKKVIYIVKSELHIYPPCIAQIRMLKKRTVWMLKYGMALALSSCWPF